MKNCQEITLRKLQKPKIEYPHTYIAELVQNMTKIGFLTKVTGQRPLGGYITFRFKNYNININFITIIAIETATLTLNLITLAVYIA